MDLYQELILEHSKRPQFAGLRPGGAESHQHNATCGDDVTLRVQLDTSGDEPIVADISYDMEGCSISTASTSMLAENLIGQPLSTARTIYAHTKDMLTSRGRIAGDENIIGDAIALSGVSKFPARVKCALLSWSALQDALAQEGFDLTLKED